MPSLSAWKADIGRRREENLFARRTRGAPHKLCEWLEIEQNEAKDKFFWIQRANCAVSIGKRFAFQHCSNKFLDRAMDLVKPKLILILETVAAECLFQFREIRSVMGQIMVYRGHDCYRSLSPFSGSWKMATETRARKVNQSIQEENQRIMAESVWGIDRR